MEFSGICVDDIFRLLCLHTICCFSARICNFINITCHCISGINPAVTSFIINPNSRLYIVTIHVELHASAIIFHRFGFHLHARGNKVVTIKDWRHSIQNMVPSFFYIISHFILKWKHALNVQVSRSGYQIFDIRVFSCKLKPNQMTSIVQISVLNDIRIFDGMPPGRFHHSDISTLFRRH